MEEKPEINPLVKSIEAGIRIPNKSEAIPNFCIEVKFLKFLLNTNNTTIVPKTLQKSPKSCKIFIMLSTFLTIL